MENSLGSLIIKSPPTASRALSQVLKREGIKFDSSLFPFVWTKKKEDGAEIICFYPKFSESMNLWLNQDFLIPNEGSLLTPDSFKREIITTPVLVPSSLMKSSELLNIEVQYLKITLVGKIKKFKSKEEEALFLFKNPKITYLNYHLVKNLYYQLGFPSKEFDNLGFFWKNGLLRDLTLAAAKKIA